MTTILVVDDHPSFRAQARALLAAGGFEVVGEAASGRSAVEMCGRLRPDVVLLDIGLPDSDGFEVARGLALLDSPPAVVLTSSRDASAYGDRLPAPGTLGFLAKDELSVASLGALVEGGARS